MQTPEWYDANGQSIPRKILLMGWVLSKAVFLDRFFVDNPVCSRLQLPKLVNCKGHLIPSSPSHGDGPLRSRE
jgi:hypothetical protein